MDPGMLHGLTSPRGFLPSPYANTNVARQLRLMAIATNERCNDTSQRNILASTHRLCGSAIASTTTFIGTIVSLTAFFLISTGTSLLSWRSNSGIPFAPGSKSGLYMSLWLREYLDHIGNTPPVRSPPTMIRRSSFPNYFTTLPVFRHCNHNNLGSTSYGSGN